MKLFAIRDEYDISRRDLAYLFYYETEKNFYIELPEDADPWETPLLLDSFVKRGETSVNSYWSKIWVQQRIVPPDRQNIGNILKDNGLEYYDEYELLVLSMGRCAQDDYYLVPLDKDSLPDELVRRFSQRLEDILPLSNFCLLAFFSDGAIKKCSAKDYFEENRAFAVLLNNPELFHHVKLQTGGHGVAWDVNLTISSSDLYRIGTEIPLTSDDFRSFVQQRVVNAAEAADILGCSRQNINYLAKHGELHPVKTSDKNTLYLKKEILQRNWK